MGVNRLGEPVTVSQFGKKYRKSSLRTTLGTGRNVPGKADFTA